MNKEEKVCTIINGHFSYILKVDGIETSFTVSYNADYFEEHYKNLGYEVIRINHE